MKGKEDQTTSKEIPESGESPLENAIKRDIDNEIIMSAEELKEHKDDLIKSFEDYDSKDEHKCLSILKILQRVRMSEPLLLETKIGKAIRQITEIQRKGAGETSSGEYFQDKAIKEVAGNLLATWKKLVPRKQPVVKKFEIPHIPGSIKK